MIFLFKSKNLKDNKAFTLIEMLVAVSIFSLAILAILAVIGGDLKNINYAKKKLIATYLATEGIEYMRNIRDTYGLYDSTQLPAVDGWVAFKNKVVSDCNPSSSCYIDINEDEANIPPQDYDIFGTTNMPITGVLVAPCAILGCPPFYYHASNGKYDYLLSNGVLTDFRRSIVVNVINADELQIVSTVSWVQGSGVQSVSFYDHFFNQI